LLPESPKCCFSTTNQSLQAAALRFILNSPRSFQTLEPAADPCLQDASKTQPALPRFPKQTSWSPQAD
jgi:hypothetical protein